MVAMNSSTCAIVFVCVFLCFGCKAPTDDLETRADDLETRALTYSARQLAERELEMDLSGHALFESCDYKSNQYSIRGGMSDGCALLVLEFSEDEAKFFESRLHALPKKWSANPMSKDQLEAISFTEYRWPKGHKPGASKSGWFLLVDRQVDKSIPIGKRANLNFTFALYDKVNRVLFFQMLDT